MSNVDFRTSSLFETKTYQDKDQEKNDEMLDRILFLIEKPGANAFWLQFKEKALLMRSGSGPTIDAQYLLHSNVYYIRDFLEEHQDEKGLDLLDELERDCF
ncbi:N(2)-fixation sustaining protein CowN [Vibrio sp. RC27]